jgi:hypothetical protein
MKAIRVSPRQLWLSDPMLVALLVVLLVLIFLMPLLPVDRAGRIAIDLFFSLLLLSGVVTLSRTRVGLWLGTAVAGSALVVRWIDRLVANVHLSEWDAVLTLATEVTLAAVLLAQIFRESGPVTIFRIAGAVVVYLLLGQVWVNLYWLLENLHPGTFHFVTTPSPSDLLGRLVYFSYETLTTAAYGDVTPLTPVARSAANLEGLTGQLFPAILIGRLVGMEIESRREREGRKS